LTDEQAWERLSGALPHRRIDKLPSDTSVPTMPRIGSLSDYNGFTGKERLRTFEVAKWLIGCGAMDAPGDCDICGRPATGLHAENYYDLSTWIDLCHGCHVSRLHQRFARAESWSRWLDQNQLPDDHWARKVPPRPTNFATHIRSLGQSEPTFASFVGFD
jgi:hypothetical protein